VAIPRLNGYRPEQIDQLIAAFRKVVLRGQIA